MNAFKQIQQKYKSILEIPGQDEKLGALQQFKNPKQANDENMVNQVRFNSEKDLVHSAAFGSTVNRFGSQQQQQQACSQQMDLSQCSSEQVKGSKTKQIRSKQPSKKQKNSLENERPNTVPPKEIKTDRQVKAYLKKQLKNISESERLPSENYVMDEITTYLSSQKFNAKLKKRKLLEQQKLIVVNDDYTEVIYNKKQHDRALQGCFSRQYDTTFFVDEKITKFVDLFDEMDSQLFKAYSAKEKLKIFDLIQQDQNQLIVIYDSRKPKEIRNSKNRESVLQSQSNQEPRILGFAVFQETFSQYQPSLFIHKIFGKSRRKEYKNKVLVALRTTQERLRAKQILIAVDDKNMGTYIKSGYKHTTMSFDELADHGLEYKVSSRLMKFQTLQKFRDIKTQIYKNEVRPLKKKAKRLKRNIEKYKKWVKKHKVWLQKKVDKNVRQVAVGSDQAQTPRWLMSRVRRFTNLKEEHIMDPFVYQPQWSRKAFYDGYQRKWDPDIFHYCNSPFTQGFAALKKCADFQAAGGNCAMILPSISLVNNLLYQKRIRKITVKQELPLFAFDGYKTPLLMHITLLYFLQPGFTNDLIYQKKARVINSWEYSLSDNTKIKIRHVPVPLQSGRKKREFNEEEKALILEQYLCDKSIYSICKQLHVRYQSIRQFLNQELGEQLVDQEQDSRSKYQKTNRLFDHLQEKVF